MGKTFTFYRNNGILLRFFISIAHFITALLFLLLLPNNQAFAQTTLSGTFKDTPLSEVFRKLEKKEELSIAHDPNQIKGILINAVFYKKTIKEAFDILLKGTNLQADVTTERYVIITSIPVLSPPEVTQICGLMIDIETGERLPYGVVFSTQTRRYARTDSMGYFKMTLPTEVLQHDSILLQYLGYQPIRLPAKYFSTSKCRKVALRSVQNSLMEVIIKDKAADALVFSTLEPQKNQIRPDKRGLVPALGEPDPFRMLQSLPGVSAEGEKAGDLLVRGGSSDQNLVLWEGIPIYNTSHLSGYISALNPYIVNKVDIWKGNPDADKGGRAASYIDMRSDFKHIQRPTFSVGGSQLTQYFSFQTPLFKKRVGLLFAARYGNVGDRVIHELLNQVDDGRKGYIRRLTGGISPLDSIFPYRSANLRDGNLKLYWQINKRSLLEFASYLAHDRSVVKDIIKYQQFSFTFGTEISNLHTIGNSIRWKQQWSDNIETELVMSYSKFNSNYTGTDTFSITNQQNWIKDFRLNLDNRIAVSNRHTLQFGYELNAQEVLFSGISTAKFMARRIKIYTIQMAPYIQWKYAINNYLNLDIGLRTQIFWGSLNIVPDPRCRLTWTASERLTFNLNAGFNSQFVGRIGVDNDLSANTNIWLTKGNRTGFQPFTNKQISLGATYKQNGWWASVEGYAKYINPLNGQQLRLNGRPQPMPGEGEERAAGIETMLRKRWGPYTSWVSYTLSRSTAQYPTVDSGRPFSTDFDRRHNLRWNHHAGWKHWDIGLTYTYQSGRKYTPATVDTVSMLYTTAQRNSEELGSYHRVDLSLQYLFYARWFRGSAGLTFFNVFDTKNQEYRQSYLIGRSIETLDITSPGIIFNVFLLFKF